MDSYEIHWKRLAEHDLRSIDPQQISPIIKAVESLVNNPFPSQCRKLKGSERIYRIRIGNYRVAYQLNIEAKVIIIYRVRHRKEAYRK